MNHVYPNAFANLWARAAGVGRPEAPPLSGAPAPPVPLAEPRCPHCRGPRLWRDTPEEPWRCVVCTRRYSQADLDLQVPRQ